MSFTPKNLPMFTACYAGAVAGMGASDRVPTSANPVSYLGLQETAFAFAHAFDNAWNDATTANELDLQAAETVAEGVWQGRAPLATPADIDPANPFLVTLANACVAMIHAGDTFLAGQGITPPAGGVSGRLTFSTAATEGDVPITTNDPNVSASSALQTLIDTYGPAGVTISHGPNTQLYFDKPLRIPYSNVGYVMGDNANITNIDNTPVLNTFPFFIFGPTQSPPLGPPIATWSDDGPSWDLTAANTNLQTLAFGKCGELFYKHNESTIVDLFGITIEFEYHVNALGPNLVRQSIFGSAGRYSLDLAPVSAVWFQQVTQGGVGKIFVNVAIGATVDVTHWQVVQLTGGSLNPGDDTQVALTYDHTTLKLWVGGHEVDSIVAPGVLLQQPYEEWFIGARPEMPGAAQQFVDSGVADALLGRIKFSNAVRYFGPYTPENLDYSPFTLAVVRFDEIYHNDVMVIDAADVLAGRVHKAYIPVSSSLFVGILPSNQITASGVQGGSINAANATGFAGIFMERSLGGCYVKDINILANQYVVWMNNNCFLSTIENVTWEASEIAPFAIGLVSQCHFTPIVNCNGIEGGNLAYLSIGSGSTRLMFCTTTDYRTLAFAGIVSDCQLVGFETDTEGAGGQQGCVSFSQCNRASIESGNLSAGSLSRPPIIVDGGGPHSFRDIIFNLNSVTPGGIALKRIPTALSVFNELVSANVPVSDGLGILTEATKGLTVSGQATLSRQFRDIPNIPSSGATLDDVVNWILRTQAEMRNTGLIQATYDPVSDLTGMVAWFSADTNVTQAGTVSLWSTKAGPVLSVAQGSVPNQPTFNASGGIVGGPYLESTDGLSFLESSGVDIMDPTVERILVWVGRLRGLAGLRPDGLTLGGVAFACGLTNNAIMMGASVVQGGNSPFSGAASCWVSGRGITETNPFNVGQQYVGVVGPSANLADNDDPHVFTVHYVPGGISTLRIDGQFAAGTASGIDADTESGGAGFSIFGSNILISDSSIGYVGTIEELFVIDDTGVSLTNIQALESALLQKYALGAWAGAGALPSGVSSESWSPLLLDPTAWFRGDNGVIIAGGNVTVWEDGSGNGHDAPIKAGSPANPTVATLGGQIALHFAASVLAGITSNLFPTAGAIYTVLMVAQSDNAGGGFIFCLRTSGSQSNSGFYLGVDAYTDSVANVVALSSDVSTEIQSPFLSEHRYLGAGFSPEIRLNRTDRPVASGVQGSEGGGTGFEIGSNGPGQVWTGPIAEIVVIERTLTDAERTAWEQYVSNRYGI